MTGTMPGSIRPARSSTGQSIWLIEIDTGVGPNGKRRRTRRTAHSKAEAERIRKDLWLERESAKRAPATQESLETFGHWWLHTVKKGRVRPSTLGDYEYRLRQYAYPVFGKKRLGEIGSRDIESWMKNLRAQGLGIATINGARKILNQLFEHAVRVGSVGHNPVAATDPLVRPHGEPTQVRDPWTLKEAQRALSAAQGTPVDLFVTLGVSYGLRRGEALGLRWADIDFEEGTLRIARGLKQVREYSSEGEVSVSLQTDDPKTSSSRRVLPLAGLALAALHRHKSVQGLARAAAAAVWQETDYVFTTRVGTPVSPTNMRRAFMRFLEQNDIRVIRIHDMRHTAAVLSLEKGVRIEAVSQALGHSDIRQTKATYAPQVQSLNDEFADGLSSYLAPLEESIDALTSDPTRHPRSM